MNVEDWDITGITNMQDAFKGCDNFSGLDNRDWPEQWIIDLAIKFYGNVDGLYEFSKKIENAFNSGCILIEVES